MDEECKEEKRKVKLILKELRTESREKKDYRETKKRYCKIYEKKKTM